MTSSKLYPKWIDSLKEPKNYLQKIQKESKKKLTYLGYPNPKNESWRNNKLKRLESFVNLPLSSNKATNYQDIYPFLINNSENIFQIKLDNLEDNFTEIALPEGIRHLSSSEVEDYLGNAIKKCKCKDSWSTLINESSGNQVLGLEIKGQNITPVELILPANSNSFNSTRILLKIEKNTDFKLVQVVIGSKNSSHSNLVEVILGENSNLEHGFISLGDNEASLIANLAITQDIKSNYSLISIHEGWLFSRFEPHIIQTQGKAKTTLKGLQVGNKDQQLSTYSNVIFEGPEGELNQLNKAAAKKNSHILFNGQIEVPRIAQKTQAAQLSRNLILSKRAQIDTKPELKIIADDVRCTHGATVSQLQEEELFYLRSRGIGSDQAYSLLLEGYYKEILSQIPLYSTRWKILNNLLSREIE